MDQKFLSHLQGPHKHCYAGVVAVGTTLILGSFLGDTIEFVGGLLTLGGVFLYTNYQKTPDPTE